MRPNIDPVDYVRKFCSEMGIPMTGRQAALASRAKSEVDSKAAKRRLFLRMYQYSGKEFVIRAYDRILGRHATVSELEAAQQAFFEERCNRTKFMLALRYSSEGRSSESCAIIGLPALRLLWKVTRGLDPPTLPRSGE
jgi:hypothetical protein